MQVTVDNVLNVVYRNSQPVGLVLGRRNGQIFQVLATQGQKLVEHGQGHLHLRTLSTLATLLGKFDLERVHFPVGVEEIPESGANCTEARM